MNTRSPRLDDVYPVRRGPSGERLCRYCGQPVPKPRLAWCSDACVREAMIRVRPNFARAEVERRDKGVCAECGFDTGRVSRTVNRINRLNLGYSRLTPARRATLEARLASIGRYLTARGYVLRYRMSLWAGSLPTLWEADHITPVVEGGNLCGLENYRTLCVPCHKRETAALARRRAEARREATTPSLPLGTGGAL